VLHRSTIQLLRLHFSLFLLPVYLFALSQVPQVDWTKAAFLFIILHVLVYPASNGYNSYMDRDETPIGGLKAPLQPTRQLFWVTVILDALAIGLACFLSPRLSLCIILYIAASRAYSYRGIRLKRFPLAGFLTVFFFQGALIYYAVFTTLHPSVSIETWWLPALISSLLIGALYPLTQIYQHEEDLADGVITISYLLGKRGSFVLSMLQFLLATGLMYWLMQEGEAVNHFLLFLLMLLPVVLFFLYWMRLVWTRPEKADFRNSLRMNILATTCTTAFFVTLIVLNH
jgi:1,4-dihydroxy-2-naphthoate octaprenyltransferase